MQEFINWSIFFTVSAKKWLNILPKEHYIRVSLLNEILSIPLCHRVCILSIDIILEMDQCLNRISLLPKFYEDKTIDIVMCPELSEDLPISCACADGVH